MQMEQFLQPFYGPRLVPAKSQAKKPKHLLQRPLQATIARLQPLLQQARVLNYAINQAKTS